MRMQRQKHIAVWLRMLAEREISLRTDAKKLLASQGRSAANAYKREGSISAVEEVIKNGEQHWNKTLTEHYHVIIKQFSDYTNEELIGNKSKTNFLTRVKEFINKQGLIKSKYITGTTIDKARTIINKGHDNGDSQNDISEALEDGIGGAISDFRADTIARTEVHNAATFAMQETAEEVQEKTSTNLTREWVAVDDERTREWHVAADGQQRGLDEPFDVDDEEIDRPGEGSPENAINCRCTLIYYATE